MECFHIMLRGQAQVRKDLRQKDQVLKFWQPFLKTMTSKYFDTGQFFHFFNKYIYIYIYIYKRLTQKK